MRRIQFGALALLVFLSARSWLTAQSGAGPVEDAIATYNTADYVRAIPLLEAAVKSTPKDPILRADLLSALVYEGRVDEASDAADADAAEFPESPELLTARGEFAFYLGDTFEAEKLFKQALKLKDNSARALFGLYRLYRAASMYRTARLLCLRAYTLDPHDPIITLAYLPYLIPEKRDDVLRPFIASHPWLMKSYEREQESRSQVRNEVNGRKIFELDGPPKEITLPLVYLNDDPHRIRGVGLKVSINGGHPLRLLLDTGASGIVVKQQAIDQAGLAHLGSFEATGVGDKGGRATFASVADSCSIGGLAYKTCVLEAVEGKARISGYEDGLIGPDVFSDYVIAMDFQKRTLHLTPQPERPNNPQGYDRVIPPGEATFTKVFRYGHELLIPTKLNDKRWGLFLLDTGAEISNVDSTFARLSTKIHENEYMRVSGVSGEVKDVFRADKAVLQFSRYKQDNLDLTAFNLNTTSGHQELRLAGVLGIPVLSMFRLTIDYRNGLVNFDYVLK